MFPRELSAREFEWIAWLLPEDRPGYRRILELVKPKFVLGEGRWGRYDFVLGDLGGAIDRSAGMLPVVAFGSIHGDECDLTLSLHSPNDDGQIEFQISPSTNAGIPAAFHEQSRWTYSTWSPGEPCPASGSAVREVVLPTASHAMLRLVIAPQRRVLWLHDSNEGTNMLVPVTNFYNELMLSKRIRDPRVALDHTQLFLNLNAFSDAELIEAFKRYNVLYHKVNVGVFDSPAPTHHSIWKRLFGRP